MGRIRELHHRTLLLAVATELVFCRIWLRYGSIAIFIVMQAVASGTTSHPEQWGLWSSHRQYPKHVPSHYVSETRRFRNLFLIFYSYKETCIIRSKIKHFTISAMAFDVTISLTLEVKGCASEANATVCLIFIVPGQRTWIKYRLRADRIVILHYFPPPRCSRVNCFAAARLRVLLWLSEGQYGETLCTQQHSTNVWCTSVFTDHNQCTMYTK